jgi:predicted MFS family arabinose efflux permease
MRADGLDAASYGKIVSVNGALIVLLQPWIIARLAELPRTPVLMVAALLVGLGFFGHALADSRSAHLLAVVIWTAGEIALVPMAAGVVAELAPASQRGRYQGAYGMTWSVAHVTGPWIATHAFAQVGVFGWGVACACVGGCSALLYAWFGLRGDRHARATLAS